MVFEVGHVRRGRIRKKEKEKKKKIVGKVTVWMILGNMDQKAKLAIVCSCVIVFLSFGFS